MPVRRDGATKHTKKRHTDGSRSVVGYANGNVGTSSYFDGKEGIGMHASQQKGHNIELWDSVTIHNHVVV